MKMLFAAAAAAAVLTGPALAQGQFSSGPKGYGWHEAAPAASPTKPPNYRVAPPAPYQKPKTDGAPATPKPETFKPYEGYKPYSGSSVYRSGSNATSPYAPKAKKPIF